MKNNKFIKMTGGRLCEFNDVDNDIYTKGRQFISSMPHIWLDKDNENIIIKNVTSESDCEIAKRISEMFDFVPRYYGCYTCNDIKLRPKYKKPGEFDEIKNKKVYLIMERLNGRSLDDNTYTFEEKTNLLESNIDNIYFHYLILCDAGIKWRDLYCRNIIIAENGKLYFIDFEYDNTSFLNTPIPENKRHTRESLLKDIMTDLKDTNNYNGGKLRKHKSRKHKSRKHKSRKHKSKKHKSRKHK